MVAFFINGGRQFFKISRQKNFKKNLEQMAYEVNTHYEPDLADNIYEDIEDNLLRLIFMTCHPALSENVRVAPTLRLVGGLTSEEFANAILVPEPTICIGRLLYQWYTDQRQGWSLSIHYFWILALKNYHLLPSVKGNFLLKLARKREALEEFQRAALLTQNVQEQKFLMKQAKDCMK